MDEDLVIRKYICGINESLATFAKEANSKLNQISEELNRCQTNLVILEKKLANQ